MILKVSNLEKTYKGRVSFKALNNINMKVSEGEFVAIMGPSGSGKSTFLNTISTIDKPTGGSVLIAGKNPFEMNDLQLSTFRREELGFVFQQFNLINTLTVGENIILPLTLDSIVNNLDDVAGIRVICSFLDDIYEVADMLTRQDDVNLIAVKDYIKKPKENGYRSYHLIIEIPVFFSEKKQPMRVEVQIRTIAMDFWASLEHKLRYKKQIDPDLLSQLSEELRICSKISDELDRTMQSVRERLET